MTKPPVHLEDRKLDGARQYSPTAARNSGPIADVLGKALPKNGIILEIACGSGEQGLAVCQARPDIIWQPSDPEADARASADSWALDLPAEQMRLAKNINVLKPLEDGLSQQFDALYCSNMIHIAPSACVEGLAKTAKAALKTGGQVFIYGPFLFGADSAPSNLAFDERLKLRDSDWGVRELDIVKHIFASHGLNFTRKTEMPANNHILTFAKA